MIIAALLLQVATFNSVNTFDQTDIPHIYQGHWVLDRKFCADAGPASVWITARHIDFWERHGFLDLAQIDEATDPATFHGTFRWAELLHFSTSTVRLELSQGKLYITEANDPDAPRNQADWSRCPS